MLAGGAGLPHDPEPDLAGNALLIEDDLAHDKAQQALALGRGGRCRMPYQPRPVLGQGLQPSPIGITRYKQLCGAPCWYSRLLASAARSFSSQARSSERATSRFSGSTASYWCRV